MTNRATLAFNLAALPGPLAWPQVREGPAPLPAAPAPGGRILVGGVGYQLLGDHSIGPLLIEALAAREWPADILIEDVSFGPIDVLFKLQAEQPPIRAAIFVGAVERGRTPGTVTSRRWRGARLGLDELQGRIGEGLMGVVSLDNLLAVLDHFGALPAETLVVEIEPEPGESWSAAVSPAGERAREEAARIIEAAIASFGPAAWGSHPDERSTSLGRPTGHPDSEAADSDETDSTGLTPGGAG